MEDTDGRACPSTDGSGLSVHSSADGIVAPLPPCYYISKKIAIVNFFDIFGGMDTQDTKRFSRFFHHPDISIPVLSRRISLELLEIFDILGEFITHTSWAVFGPNCYPNRMAYHNAVCRLRKKGLAVCRRTGGKAPVMTITGKGESLLNDVHRPLRMWNRKWNGIWYVLMYDVPERQRKYRDAVRWFLRSMRMGRLQRSVWITPRDIRPEYDDLNEAGAFNDYAFLFESRTVLGRKTKDVVWRAWDFEGLETRQRWYLEVFMDNLKRVSDQRHGHEELFTLAREEMSAYTATMAGDPLLPREMWPSGYCGESVYDLHIRINKEIGRRLIS